jgi:ribonuclease D
MGGRSYTFVESAAGLEELSAVLASAPWHALDTESNSGFAYLERLCLLQLNVSGRIWLVDLVALAGDGGIEGLRPPLEDPERRTYLHGGEFDVGCLKRDYDISLGGVWDSQQAAAFLGFPRTGYASVVEEICGLGLEKAYTHYNWARRPLEEEVLAYAVDDVRYLPEVCQALEERIAEADLELPRTALPLLSELWRWRDRVASEEDRAPGRTLNNRTLLALSRNPPRNSNSLRRLGVPGRLAGSRHGVDLLRLVQRVRREPPDYPPRPRNSAAGNAGRAERELGDRLKAWRNAEAERRQVPVQVVLPSRALDHLKRNGAGNLESVPQLGPKRIRMYGDALRELLAKETRRRDPERGEIAS